MPARSKAAAPLRLASLAFAAQRLAATFPSFIHPLNHTVTHVCARRPLTPTLSLAWGEGASPTVVMRAGWFMVTMLVKKTWRL
jgi:hypothetical protein